MPSVTYLIEPRCSSKLYLTTSVESGEAGVTVIVGTLALSGVNPVIAGEVTSGRVPLRLLQAPGVSTPVALFTETCLLNVAG